MTLDKQVLSLIEQLEKLRELGSYEEYCTVSESLLIVSELLDSRNETNAGFNENASYLIEEEMSNLLKVNSILLNKGLFEIYYKNMQSYKNLNEAKGHFPYYEFTGL